MRLLVLFSLALSLHASTPQSRGILPLRVVSVGGHAQIRGMFAAFAPVSCTLRKPPLAGRRSVADELPACFQLPRVAVEDRHRHAVSNVHTWLPVWH